ncbi:MAG: trifunctional transcriptional activator/DNA repair protein Ada/methylated-DNA--[protein]-cysteine S-methyltransferase, partial [Myxococcota bacterium]
MARDGFSEAQLYAALLTRDEAFEGKAWVGVTTTGIFCRLTCPARKPRRENTRFFFSVGECMQAGFRPCLRCRPLDGPGLEDPLVSALVQRLLADPERRWREVDLRELGYDPSTVRRAFKRQIGTTFLELARSVRLSRGGSHLAEGHRVIDAQLTAGFGSSSGFRDAFAKRLGLAPGQLGEGRELRGDWLATPLGPVLAVARESGLALLAFFDRPDLPRLLERLGDKELFGVGRFPAIDHIEAELGAYFEGRSPHFETSLSAESALHDRMLSTAVRAIPAGSTASAKAIVEALGSRFTLQTLIEALGANPLTLLVPCHRILGAGAGKWRTQWLLNHE